MAVPKDRKITIRPVGTGAVILKAWKGRDGKPHYMEETEGMTDAQKARVVRFVDDDLPVGKKELTSGWEVPLREKNIIQALKEHPFCDANPKCRQPQLLYIDHYEKMENEENFAASRFKLQEAILKLPNADLKGFCSVVGVQYDGERLSSVKSRVQNRYIASEKSINEFFDYFKVSETANAGIKSISLKDEHRMEALVIAAISSGALITEPQTGAISFKNEIIGVNTKDAAINLLNNTEAGKSKLLPSIKSALSGKG